MHSHHAHAGPGESRFFRVFFRQQLSNAEVEQLHVALLRLIGRWSHSDTYTSGDFSGTAQVFLQVNPDGTYAYGNGRVMEDSPGVSGDTGALKKWLPGTGARRMPSFMS